MTYRRISTNQPFGISGPGDLDFARFQFDCYAATYAECKEITAALRSVFVGFSGIVSSIDICGTWFLNEVDRFDDRADVLDIVVDIRVSYK